MRERGIVEDTLVAAKRVAKGITAAREAWNDSIKYRQIGAAPEQRERGVGEYSPDYSSLTGFNVNTDPNFMTNTYTLSMANDMKY